MLPFSPRNPLLFLLLTGMGLWGLRNQLQAGLTFLSSPSPFGSILVTNQLQRSPQKGSSWTPDAVAQSQQNSDVCSSLIACRVSCETIASPAPFSTPLLTFAGEQDPDDLSIADQGDWVCVNDRPLAIPWIQIQAKNTSSPSHFALQDFALEDQLGLNLLASTQGNTQPVGWFDRALPTSELPLHLPLYLSDRFRYLSLTPLLEKGGWQAQIQGEKLHLHIPPAQIQELRFGRQGQGYRVVLDLDRPVVYAMQTENDRWTLQLEGSLADPFLSSGFAQFLKQDPIAQTLQWQMQPVSQASPHSSAPQVQLQAILPPGLVPQVSSLSHPFRLVMDFQPRSFIEKSIVWAPGIIWQQHWINLRQKAFPIVQIRLEAHTLRSPQSPLQLRPLFPQSNTLAQLQSLTQLAQNSGAIVAINAGFFNRNNQLPLGAIQTQSQWISGTILNRGAMAWNDQRFPLNFDRLTLQETLITPNLTIPLTELNSGYVRGGIARYTPQWGTVYQSLIDNEIVITVVNNQVTQWQELGKAGSQNIPVPPNGYLLTARANATIARQLPVGTPLQLTQRMQPPSFNAAQILGAGPLLQRQGVTVLDAAAEGFSPAFIQQAALRSAVGQTAQGDLLLVTIAATPGGAVPTLAEMAEIMATLGTIDALNLDGGSSSSLYLGGKLLNRSPRTVARIHNALGVIYGGD